MDNTQAAESLEDSTCTHIVWTTAVIRPLNTIIRIDEGMFDRPHSTEAGLSAYGPLAMLAPVSN